MKVELSIADASDADLERLGEAMLRVAEEKGLAVQLPERTHPYTKEEVMDRLRVSERTVYKLEEVGMLKRVPCLSRFRVTAQSLHAYENAEVNL